MKSDEPIVDTSKVTLTKGDPEQDFYLHGTVNDFPGYSFVAKVFDAPSSTDGLDGGRISKLEVYQNEEQVVGYSRGWGEPPQTDEQRTVVNTIVEAFPTPGRTYNQADRERRVQGFAQAHQEHQEPQMEKPAALDWGDDPREFFKRDRAQEPSNEEEKFKEQLRARRQQNRERGRGR